MRGQGTLEEAAEELAGLIEESVGEAVRGERKVAVAFSGGVDSAVLAVCASRLVEVVAVSGFLPGSRDSQESKKVAAMLGVGWAGAQMTKDDAIGGAREARLHFEPTAMDESLWALYSAVARRARDEGAAVMLLGQLADELFGGYAKYSGAAERSEGEATAMMAKDVSEYPKRGKVRDVGACSPWVLPRFPYEAAGVVEFGLSLPLEYKIRNGERKVVLRRAAVKLGVPEVVAAAPKKAAQYSSGVQRAIS